MQNQTPNPRLYDEAVAELTVGVRQDLLAQIDTLSIAVEHEHDLDALLREAERLLDHMRRYVERTQAVKDRLDDVFLESSLRQHFSLAANQKDETL